MLIYRARAVHHLARPHLQHRTLGMSSLKIAPLVFGGNVFGWTVDESTSFGLLDAFLEAGFNCIDTADSYSRWAAGNKGGESETIIGKWLRSRGTRARVVIATKVGGDMGAGQKGLSQQHIVASVEGSLRRLQTDYIDLYQAHFDDESVPQEETLAAFARLIEHGKVRVIGASNYKSSRLAAALQTSAQHDWPRFESLQPHYNLYERADYERNLEPLCAQQRLGVIPYYSLASGFLTGKYRSANDLGQSPRGQGVKRFLNERGQRILAALDEIAAALGATPAQIALAWLLSRPTVTAPIASATTPQQLRELARGTQLQLDASSLARLDAASA
jgi:aryl-alcohol dehydrogenase-like predicted oxidoreductase